MSKEHVETTLMLAKKAATMGILQKIGRVRMPRFGFSTEALQLFAGLHISSVDVALEGQTNLANALIQAQEEHRPVIFTLRHKADADSPAFRRGIRASGRRDVANNTVWLAGVNMLTRPYILPFSFSENAVYIATPEDLNLANRLVRESEGTPVRRFIARKIASIFNKQNEQAKEEVRKARLEGKYLVFYPEAGRSKDGFLRKAPREVSVYLPRKESNAAVVIPVVTQGTDQFNRPGEYDPRNLLPENRHRVGLIIGKHYLSNTAWEISKADKSGNITPADVVMAHIYALQPQSVRPNDESLYQYIMSQYIMLQAGKRESADRREKAPQLIS